MASGARQFDTGHTQALYRLLLKAPDVADVTLSAEQCDRLFMQQGGGATSLTVLETAPSRVKRLREDAQPVVEAEFAGDDEGGPDAVDDASVVVPEPPQVARSVSSLSSFHEPSSESSRSSSSHGKSLASIGAEAEPAHADVGRGSTDPALW